MGLRGWKLQLVRSSVSALIVGTLLVSQAGRPSHADEPASPNPVIPLWPHAVPGSKGTDPDKDVPTLTIWLPKPETATGAAVVVCPGGGYQMLAVEHEGKQVAEWF